MDRAGTLRFRLRDGVPDQEVDPKWLVRDPGRDAVIEETVAGMEVKHTRIRYPLRIVRYDVDRELNPWGLAIDCFAEAPSKLEDATPASQEVN